jgi:hypothetical protein
MELVLQSTAPPLASLTSTGVCCVAMLLKCLSVMGSVCSSVLLLFVCVSSHFLFVCGAGALISVPGEAVVNVILPNATVEAFTVSIVGQVGGNVCMLSDVSVFVGIVCVAVVGCYL